MFNAIERFRTIGSQSFLDRGTVRRAGYRGSRIWRFDSELKNRLLHIFRLEAKASAEAAGEKRDRDARAASASARRVEDIIGKGSALAERMPVMPQTALLRSDPAPASESKSALAGRSLGAV
jgi:hypothetical protein